MRFAPASGHKRLMTQKNKLHPLLVLRISVFPDLVNSSEDCSSLQISWLMLGAHTSSHSGVWDGLAFGTSPAIPLQMQSNFTVLVLHTHTCTENWDWGLNETWFGLASFPL